MVAARLTKRIADENRSRPNTEEIKWIAAIKGEINAAKQHKLDISNRKTFR